MDFPIGFFISSILGFLYFFLKKLTVRAITFSIFGVTAISTVLKWRFASFAVVSPIQKTRRFGAVVSYLKSLNRTRTKKQNPIKLSGDPLRLEQSLIDAVLLKIYSILFQPIGQGFPYGDFRRKNQN